MAVVHVRVTGETVREPIPVITLEDQVTMGIIPVVPAMAAIPATVPTIIRVITPVTMQGIAREIRVTISGTQVTVRGIIPV